MRSIIVRRPWDLIATMSYTLIVLTGLILAGAGNVAATALILFAPGYVLVAAIFPGKSRVTWIERLALSVGLSIAVVPVLGLLLNYTPFGFRFAPIVAILVSFTILVGLCAYWRRMRLPVDERVSATLVLSLPSWRGYTLTDKATTVAISSGIIVAMVAGGYLVSTQGPVERFTEFFILSSSGNSTDYPTNLTRSSLGTVILTIVNHEASTVAYSVRVDISGLQAVSNGTVERNRTTISWINVTRDDGQSWSQPFTFSVAYPGLWKLQFFLYKNGGLTNQELQLFLTVA